MINWQPRVSTTDDGQISVPSYGSFPTTSPEPQELTEGEAIKYFSGSISDSNWVRESLDSFYQDTIGLLEELAEKAEATQGGQFNDYRNEVRERKKIEHVADVIDQIDERINQEIQTKERGLSLIRDIREVATKIKQPESEIQGLRFDLKAKEIREAVKEMAPMQQRSFLENMIRDNDLFALSAIEESLTPIVDLHSIDKTKEQIIETHFKWINDWLSYHTEVSKGTKIRTREVYTVVSATLSNYGLSLDKVNRYREALNKAA